MRKPSPFPAGVLGASGVASPWASARSRPCFSYIGLAASPRCWVNSAVWVVTRS